MNKITLILFLGSLLFSCSSTGTHRNRLKLVIDHDGGADDAMAIFMSILYEKYFDGPRIVAITTTNGNVNETQAYINTQRFLTVANRLDIPIYRGATRSLVETVETDHFFGVDGLGDLEDVSYKEILAQKEHAAFALIELSKKYQDQLIVMAIAPQTNIALAKRLDPEFESRLKQLYIGAGTIYNESDPSPEFNAELDVESYRIAVDSATPDKVTIVPFSEVMKNVSRQWREDVLGAIPTEIMKALNQYERISIEKSNEWTLLDPIVAAIVLDGNVVEEYKYTNNSIILCENDLIALIPVAYDWTLDTSSTAGLCSHVQLLRMMIDDVICLSVLVLGKLRGINTNDFQSAKPNVRAVGDIKEDYYMKLLIDIFSAQLRQC